MAMRLIPDIGVFQKKLATLPVVAYQADETVLSAASRTGRLPILKEGEVAVVRKASRSPGCRSPVPCSVRLSVLLDEPHTADVRALTASQFHVADAATLLKGDPIALLYVGRSWRSVSTAPFGVSSS